MLLKEYIYPPLRAPKEEVNAPVPQWQQDSSKNDSNNDKQEIVPPLAPPENNISIPKTIWQQNLVKPETKGETATLASTSVKDNIQQRLQDGEDVFSVLLNKQYDDDKQSLERKRKAALIGDIAQLFGQSISLAAGARKFSPIQSQVPYYNDQLQKLKNWRNSANMNYSLSQAKNEYNLKKENQKLALDKYKMDIQQGQFGDKLKLEYAKLAESVRNHKITQEQADKKLAESMRHNKASESIASYNAGSSRISANAAKERANNPRANNNDSIVVKDTNGNTTSVTFSKEKRGSLISLIGRMKQKITENAAKMSKDDREQYIANLDDIKLQFDSPDHIGEAMTILQTRLQDFPELTNEFYSIIGQENKSTHNNNVAPYRR